MKRSIVFAAILSVVVLTVQAEENVADASKEKGLNTRILTQVGIVVNDIEKTSKAWAELLGVPVPKWILTDPVETGHTVYLGKSTTGRAKLVFFDLGQVQLELIEPVGGPSTWKDVLDRKGEGVHHIAFGVRGMDGQIKACEGLGLPLLQRGDYTGGCYAYVDGTKSVGTVLELLENFDSKK
jgi:catechol 2,3-dioxygenase-like lactoylglutathione lyase family enzyme